MRAGVVALAVTACSLGLGGPAAAGGGSCAATAQITNVDRTSSPSYIKRYSEQTPSGQRWTGDTLDRSHFYEIHNERVTVSFGGVTFVLWSNATVRIECAGMPNVGMLHGTVDVHTTNGVPGSVTTEEGVIAPAVSTARMFFSVHRELAQSSATAAAKLRWLHNDPYQPTGKTKAIGTDYDKISVTPNVGSRPGDVRNVIRCVLVTTTSYGHGTAAYYNAYRHG